MYHTHLATHVHMYLSIDRSIDFYRSIYLLLVRFFLVTFGNPTIYSSGLVAGETLKSQSCIHVQYREFLRIRTLNLPVFFWSLTDTICFCYVAVKARKNHRLLLRNFWFCDFSWGLFEKVCCRYNILTAVSLCNSFAENCNNAMLYKHIPNIL